MCGSGLRHHRRKHTATHQRQGRCGSGRPVALATSRPDVIAMDNLDVARGMGQAKSHGGDLQFSTESDQTHVDSLRVKLSGTADKDDGGQTTLREGKQNEQAQLTANEGRLMQSPKRTQHTTGLQPPASRRQSTYDTQHSESLEHQKKTIMTSF